MTMSKRVKLQLDWNFEDDLAASVTNALEAAEMNDAWWRVVMMDGPGGGAPIVEFVIERNDAWRFVLAYCAGDAEQAGGDIMPYLEPLEV